MGISYSKKSSGISDHGNLSGLVDDDHSQYHNTNRANTWLGTKDTDNLSEGATNSYYPAGDKSKLALIEALATADQSAAEIKTLLEAPGNHLDADYVDEGATNLYYPSADKTIVEKTQQKGLWHYEGLVINGNALILQIHGSQAYNAFGQQDIPAINDEITWSIKLSPGTYNFCSLGIKHSDRGIATWRLDSTQIAVHDWYSAGGQYNQVQKTTGIIVTGGVYTLSSKIESNNVASSDYRFVATRHWFVRTGN